LGRLQTMAEGQSNAAAGCPDGGEELGRVEAVFARNHPETIMLDLMQPDLHPMVASVP
jgi:hypothetical protein